MKTKFFGKVLAQIAALVLFANTSAWGAGSASPNSVMVPVGGSVSVTITNDDSNDRTLRIGSTGSSELGTWSNASLSATLSSTSVRSDRTTTLTITGLAANDSAQTISIYRTGGNTAVWCSITVSKVVAPIEKTVAVDETLTFDSTEQITSRYYYQFASADTSFVTATPNGTNTRNGYGDANVSLSVTGLKATTSPVVVTLQQRSGTSGNFTPVELYSVTVRDLPQEARTGTVEVNGLLTVSASDLDGEIRSVRSSNASVATVTLENGVATIAGVAQGSATVNVRTATTNYVYTVTVMPLTIYLCVGDVAKFNYNFGGTGANQGSLLRVGTTESAVTATCATQGSSASSSGVRYYQSGYLQITANDVGSQTVTLQRRVRGQTNYVDYDIINVVVLPERMIATGASSNYVCKASLNCTGGSATWTSLAQSPTGVVNAEYGTCSAKAGAVTLTGLKRGTTTVTAKNVQGTNNNYAGLEYALRVVVRQPEIVGEPVTVYEGESVTLADDSTNKSWTATSLNANTARVTASGGAGTGAVITGVKAGGTTVEVEHDDVYYSYAVTVQPKPDVNLPTYYVYEDESVTIPADKFGGAAWKLAASGSSNHADVEAASGEAGTGVVVNGKEAGLALITFETADTKYTAHVQVNAKANVDLGIFQLKVGNTLQIESTQIAAAWSRVRSADATKVAVEGETSGVQLRGPLVRGVQVTGDDGVAVTFEDATHVYTATVQVFDKLKYDGGIRTVVPPPHQDAPSTDKTNYEAPAVIPIDPAWGADYTVTFADSSVATYEEVEGNLVVHGIPQGKRGDLPDPEHGHAGTQDNGAVTTMTISTAEADYTYTIYVVSDETHVVHFCEGDKTQIWYNDTTQSPHWFLLINDQRFELDQLGTGEQVNVTLTAQDQLLSYIIATAERVGDPDHGDLVVISDGQKYYAYRMSCSPLRMVEVGKSTNMVCRTVAINNWRVDYMSDQWGYTNYIDVVCSPDESGEKSHFTTATITGRALAGETYVLVRDDQHKAGEHNAQGAVYTLKTRVVGAPVIPVYMSPNTSADVCWDNWAAPGAAYTVEVTGTEGAVVATIKEDETTDSGFVLNLTCPAGAAANSAATVAVKAGGVALAQYNVSVTAPFSAPEGLYVPGYLYGVDATPWVSVSLDESVATVNPTKYNRMYSAEAKFLKEGSVEFHSTNAYYQAGYYFVRAKVYDTHVTDVDMTAGSTTNVLVVHTGKFSGDWTWSCDNTNLVERVELVPDPDDPTNPFKVVARITAKEGEGVKGAVNVTVTSGYHTETIRVYVSPEDGKRKLRVNGTRTIVLGETQDLPSEATAGGDWTATSMNTELVSVVTPSGAAGVQAQIKGESVDEMTIDGKSTSQTTVTVETDSTVYIYTVSVVKPTTSSLDMGVINVGETRVMEIKDNMFEGEIQSISTLDGNLTVESTYDPVTKTNTVTGMAEGQTTIVVKTDKKIYNLNVTVRTNHIDKHISLMFGEDDSQLTYSYTFDRLDGLSPADLAKCTVTTNNDGAVLYKLTNNRYSVKVEGNKVTFIPGTIEVADDQANSVVFLGQVDGLTYTSELHYWVKVTKAPEGERVLTKEGTQGYITYRGTDDVRVDPETGDLILVFTNANEVGNFSVMAPWNVKADILAVGGGGSGGSTARQGLGGGGGGAGGFTLVSNRVLTAGSFGVEVGKGALAGGTDLGLSVQGLNGEPSAVTNGFGYAMASAVGGGGGGAQTTSAETINGVNGGSGGGAAWNNRNVGTEGLAESGQGHRGGVPEVQGAGGGGGGAGDRGGGAGVPCAGGAGRTSDISGEEVTYAAGGAGGRNDVQKAGAAGAGPGYGGEGGSGAAGGSGADGIVVVRITDIFRNIKVPIPGTNTVTKAGQDGGATITLQTQMVTPRFVWTEWYQSEDPCVAFEYEGKEFRSSTNAKPIKWNDAIDSVTGTTSVKCYAGTTLEGNDDKVGVGYYSFTVRLKEGYAWEDGLGEETYGDTSPKVYRWAVVESEDVTTASINIHKTVEWSTPSNATVNVTTYTTPEMQGKTELNVLYITSLCWKHIIDSQGSTDAAKQAFIANVINSSISNILEKANVDCYLFGNTDANPSRTTPLYSQSLTCGDFAQQYKYTASEMVGSAHCNLKGYLSQIQTSLSRTDKKYDYIVLSFDCSRLCEGYPDEDEALARSAAELLKPYYDDKAVIWIVDTKFRETSGHFIDQYYLPSNVNSGNNGAWNLQEWNAYCALLDPNTFLEGDTGSWRGTDSGETSNRSRLYTANRIEEQTVYDDPNAVQDLLNSTIKIKPYNLNLRDKIKDGDSGLTIDSVSILACTKGEGESASTDPDDWTEIMRWWTDTGTFEWMDKSHVTGLEGGAMQVYMESNLVEAVISNVDFTVWTKVKIGIVDDGRFRTSEDAYYNQSTGKWEKNPNEGTAFAEMMDDLGNALNIEGEAETETPWSFNGYIISSKVQNGKAYVQGLDRVQLEVGENNNCIVSYRAYPGYLLTQVIVDGNPVSLTDHPASYVFSNVQRDHEIEIVYEPYVVGVESAPVTNAYDGLVHPFDVNVAFVTNELGQVQDHPETEVRYAPLWVLNDPELASNDVYWVTADVFQQLYGTNVPQWVASEYTDVGDHEFAYRVYAKQPGYGPDGDEGWVWIQFSNDGTDHSVITPLPLTVRPNDSELIYSRDPLPPIDFTLNGFLGGEDLALIGEEGVTNGWYVTSTYRQGDGMGLYPTWVRDATHETLWNGDPTYVLTNNPTIVEAEGLYNFGNYYLVTAQNGQAVEKLPIEISDIWQVPGLDPESPYVDTGVEKVEKLYDGVETNIVVDVTSVDPGTGNKLVPGVDYTITYALGDIEDPSTPPDFATSGSSDNPPRLHAGTNVVWYLVELIGDMDNNYFAASNYQYVVVNPRQLVLESDSHTWKFDGTEHTLPEAREVEAESDGVAEGDTLEKSATGKILHVGETPNTISYTITGTALEGDYIVTKREGTLAVTPKGMTIGGVSYDPDDYDDPDNDPNFPAIYWNSGVEDAEMVYDGTGTNITVIVTVPEDPTRFKITYTTNHNDAVWSETNPVFTNVINQAVWFRVEPVGEWASDYIPVENYARVIITPRAATVTANAATTSVGATAEPPYSATVGGDFAAKDIGHEYELIRWDAISTTNFADCVKAEGTYPGVIVPTGVATQGNYAVTYYPGTLTVVARPIVYSLWITDHADAGDGRVHLQFAPTFSKPLEGPLADWATAAATDGRIYVFVGDTPADAEDKSVTPATEGRAYKATLRDMANPVDEAAGRIWITVDEPLPVLNRASKIVIVGE